MRRPGWLDCATKARSSPHAPAFAPHVSRVSSCLVLCKAKARDHYSTLGVANTASSADIKSAFRKLALQLHPDVNKEAGAAQRFVACKEAYETLNDASSRADYDRSQRQRISGSSARSSSNSSSSGFTVDFGGGFGSIFWESVDFVVDEDDDDESEDDDDNEYESQFAKWASGVGNMRSSYQSSEQANRRKRVATARAYQQQQRREVENINVPAFLSQLDTTTRQVLQSTYGKRLETLSSIDELRDTMEIMQMMGVSEKPRQRRGARVSNWTGGEDWETFIQPDTSGRSSGRGQVPPTGGKGGRTSPAAAAAAGAAARAASTASSSGRAPSGSNRPNVTKTYGGGSSSSRSTASGRRDRPDLRYDEDDSDDDDAEFDQVLMDLSEMGFINLDTDLDDLWSGGASSGGQRPSGRAARNTGARRGRSRR